MSLAIYLHEWREAEGYTLLELAEKTGLSVSFLSDIERARTSPSMKTLQRIAAAYGLRLDVRFVRDDELTIPPLAVLISRETVEALAVALQGITKDLQFNREVDGDD